MLLQIDTRTTMTLALGALLSKLRWIPMADKNTEAVVEWIDMALVLVFAYYDVFHRAGSDELYIMVMKDNARREDAEEKEEEESVECALVGDAPASL
mmetsp:Transcript_10599/g.20752  ORF Transcript_10599/g.20752 Transcript_10599/m.20752 type:complete len:97 (+) Transcript_10599:192-482(+)